MIELSERPQTLDDKINAAIRILKISEKQAEAYGEPVEIAYSGGKDSDVILQLAKESGIKYRAIYKNTTIDPPGTIQHARENAVEIIQPKESFFTLIKKHGYPSFRFRFCCDYLKEYKMNNVAVWGVRADESQARKKRYTTFEFCRVYNKKSKVHIYAPIYNWTLSDVRNFIESRHLQLADYYYDQEGNPDFRRRLGCMGCPLQKDRGIADFKNNPALLRAYLRAGNYWSQNHKREMFTDGYELFVYRTFYRTTEAYIQAFKQKQLFERATAKEYIENFFNIKI